MIVGICKLDLHLPGCRSLKEKRQVLRRVKDRTANAFGIPVAEVGGLDLWQRSELGFAAVGSDRRVIEGILQRMTNAIEQTGDLLLLDREVDMINF